MDEEVILITIKPARVRRGPLRTRMPKSSPRSPRCFSRVRAYLIRAAIRKGRFGLGVVISSAGPSGHPRGVGEHVLSSRSPQVCFCDLLLLPLPKSERVRSLRDSCRILCHSCQKVSRTHLGVCDGHTFRVDRFSLQRHLLRTSPNARYLRPYATGLNLDFAGLAEHHTSYTL